MIMSSVFSFGKFRKLVLGITEVDLHEDSKIFLLQPEKSIVKGLAWAIASISAVEAATILGASSTAMGLASFVIALDALSDEDLFDATFYGTGCALAVLGAKVSYVAFSYAGLCFNNACHHLSGNINKT